MISNFYFFIRLCFKKIMTVIGSYIWKNLKFELNINDLKYRFLFFKYILLNIYQFCLIKFWKYFSLFFSKLIF